MKTRAGLSLIVLLIGLWTTASAAQAEGLDRPCESALSGAVTGIGDRGTPTAPKIAEASAHQIERQLLQKGFSRREARGYAIIIASMVGSAAATTFLTASLPADFQFLSQFVAQVSTIGVFVFGAPIWEPLSSGFRKMAFGVRGRAERDTPPSDAGLEAMWRSTQEKYSLNAQMSRNVVNQFILSVQQNFFEAHRAVRSGEEVYAVDQVAEAAFRMRTLFKDVAPEDVAVAAVVRSSFTRHAKVSADFVARVEQRLAELDDKFTETSVRSYYARIVETWLRTAD